MINRRTFLKMGIGACAIAQMPVSLAFERAKSLDIRLFVRDVPLTVQAKDGHPLTALILKKIKATEISLAEQLNEEIFNDPK